MTEGDGDPRHGTANGYGNLRCKCERCRRAWADYHDAGDYQRKYRAKLAAAGISTHSSFRKEREKNARQVQG